MSKTCRTCNRPLALACFNRRAVQADGLNSECRECAQSRANAYYASHPGTALSYRARNVDDCREREHEYWSAHRAQKQAKDKRYRDRYPDKTRASNRRKYLANPEKYKAQLSQWAAMHPDYVKERSRKRNSLRRGVPLDRTALQYAAIILNDPCSYCGNPSQAIDHIHPVSRGGDSHFMNLTPACVPCNAAKHNKPLLRFLLERSL